MTEQDLSMIKLLAQNTLALSQLINMHKQCSMGSHYTEKQGGSIGMKNAV